MLCHKINYLDLVHAVKSEWKPIAALGTQASPQRTIVPATTSYMTAIRGWPRSPEAGGCRARLSEARLYGWLAAGTLLERRDAISENANLTILVRGIRMPMGRLQCGDIVGGGIMERRHQTKALFRPPSLRRCNTEQNTIAGLGRGEMVKGDVRFTAALRTLSISSRRCIVTI
ncbi:hypothetical protein BDY17DRAFT_1210 [Neohortaea acidophila]|uniref:Uncharacterized protein n=1 Tax=Neohortaea acidophila TaxID=245834 RepID=A0A6A6Q4Y8_9PEZI|nr:uncharacterized protein BDY17DRAFT_1210 [Neohortaea acidophila]KAF2487016.1 hypothetical protein BDY17DRAFT_1210 [Neohortaea acidophila]